MAEDNGKQDEPELKFDSAGQAIAYLTLDQARLLALQFARDNQEFYGWPYTDLFKLMYKERSHQQQGVTGVSRFVFV